MKIADIDDRHGALKSFRYKPAGELIARVFTIHFEGSKQQLKCYLSNQPELPEPTRPVAIGYAVCKNHTLGMHATSFDNYPYIVIRERLNGNGWVIDREQIGAAKNPMEACILCGEFRNKVPTAYIRVYQGQP